MLDDERLDKWRRKIAAYKANPETTPLSGSEKRMVDLALKYEPLEDMLMLEVEQLQAAYEVWGGSKEEAEKIANRLGLRS